MDTDMTFQSDRSISWWRAEMRRDDVTGAAIRSYLQFSGFLAL